MFLITGGGSGIGQALAWHLASQEHKVLICGRREECLEETKAKFPQDIDYICADLTEAKSIAQIRDLFGSTQISALVQNAGQLLPISPLLEVDIEKLKSIHLINAIAPIQLLQAIQENLKGGRVLHISSAAAHYPFNSWGPYCMSKAGLFMAYEILKQECADISFGSVMPGVTNTDMQMHIRHADNMPEMDQKYFRSLHQENKLLAPSTVAKFLSWLLQGTDNRQFSEQEWDIYNKEHHKHWLAEGIIRDI